jgi:hypothetical protein
MGRLAQLPARELYRVLDPGAAGREVLRAGVRLVYDGTVLSMSGASEPDTVLATAASTGQEVDGFGCDWEVTAHLASVDTVRAWMRMLEADGLTGQEIGLSPFWGGGDLSIVFTTGGQQWAFPVIACPTAPVSAQPGRAVNTPD